MQNKARGNIGVLSKILAPNNERKLMRIQDETDADAAGVTDAESSHSPDGISSIEGAGKCSSSDTLTWT